jgi:DNA-binding response OmpR family regulator
MRTGPILLVDDDENDIFFMTDAFKKAEVNLPIQIVRDGQQAIDYLRGVGPFADRAQFPLPSLILLDLKLPFIMGLDVLKSIRTDLKFRTIVVILSASQEESDITSAYELGANGYLVKPSDVSKLTEMVKALHLFWNQTNTAPLS